MCLARNLEYGLAFVLHDVFTEAVTLCLYLGMSRTGWLLS